MKTRTVVECVGEYLGPVDWGYNFLSHFDGYSNRRDERCAEAVDMLRQLTNGEKWEATTDGGWPRCGWGEVLVVGMYDGWPYWRPVPSVAILGPLGGEWHSFFSITSIRRRDAK